MIAPLKQPAQKKTTRLLPQEKEGKYKFSGKFVATRHAIEKFGEAVIVACHMMLLKELKRKGGLALLCRFLVMEDFANPKIVDSSNPKTPRSGLESEAQCLGYIKCLPIFCF